jgi:hypothetical protein
VTTRERALVWAPRSPRAVCGTRPARNAVGPAPRPAVPRPPAPTQWVVTGYAITFGGLLILGGRAADLFGRSRMFRTGLIAFSVASLAGGLAQDPVLLRLRSLRKGGALIMLLGTWNGGEMLVLSLYFQQVLHDSPLMTGLAIAPQGMVGFAAGALGARLAARLGMHRLLVLTNAVAMLGFLVLTQLPATGGYSPLLAAVTFVGFGTAFGSMVTASKGVADGDQGFVGG